MKTHRTDHPGRAQARVFSWIRRLGNTRGRTCKFLNKQSLTPGLLYLALMTLWLGVGASTVLAFSQGPNFAGTQAACTFDLCGQSTGVNNNACSLVAGSLTSDSISLTNFGFSLPSSVTSVDGILVEPKAVENQCGSPSIQLLKNSSPTGSSRTFSPVSVSGTSTACSSSEFVSVGGNTDKWDATLTRDDLNNSGFGIKITQPSICNNGLLIDAVRITVFFSIA